MSLPFTHFNPIQTNSHQHRHFTCPNRLHTHSQSIILSHKPQHKHTNTHSQINTSILNYSHKQLHCDAHIPPSTYLHIVTLTLLQSHHILSLRLSRLSHSSLHLSLTTTIMQYWMTMMPPSPLCLTLTRLLFNRCPLGFIHSVHTHWRQSVNSVWSGVVHTTSTRHWNTYSYWIAVHNAYTNTDR